MIDPIHHSDSLRLISLADLGHGTRASRLEIVQLVTKRVVFRPIRGEQRPQCQAFLNLRVPTKVSGSIVFIRRKQTTSSYLPTTLHPYSEAQICVPLQRVIYTSPQLESVSCKCLIIPISIPPQVECARGIIKWYMHIFTTLLQLIYPQ